MSKFKRRNTASTFVFTLCVSIGMSRGLTPFRIFPTNVPARRHSELKLPPYDISAGACVLSAIANHCELMSECELRKLLSPDIERAVRQQLQRLGAMVRYRNEHALESSWGASLEDLDPKAEGHG